MNFNYEAYAYAVIFGMMGAFYAFGIVWVLYYFRDKKGHRLNSDPKDL